MKQRMELIPSNENVTFVNSSPRLETHKENSYLGSRLKNSRKMKLEKFFFNEKKTNISKKLIPKLFILLYYYCYIIF